MLAEDFAAERGGEDGGAVGAAVHIRFDGLIVAHDNRDFGVMIAALGTIVEVGAAADDDFVVGDEELGSVSCVSLIEGELL